MEQIWEQLTPLPEISGEERMDVVDFCITKKIDIGDLADLGTRFGVGDGLVLAYGFRDRVDAISGIKYRRLDGTRWAETGSSFPLPLMVGPVNSRTWIVAEGESDGARLHGLCPEARILILPGGAAQFRDDWAWLPSRGSEVFFGHDADDAGDKGAEKARRVIRDGVRLRPPEVKDWCAWDGDVDEFSQLLGEAKQQQESGAISMFVALEDFQQELRNPPDMTEVGVPAPLSFLKPMMPGRLYVLGGYQKDGKTALAGQFIAEAAKAGKRVGVMSLEMTWRDLRDRLLMGYGIPAHEIEHRVLSEESKPKLVRAMTEMGRWALDILDDPRMTVKDYGQLIERHGWDFVVIDHLHRMDWGGERTKLEGIVREITNLTKVYSIPVLLLAQLSRSQLNSRPTMSQLRESGMIEAEASAVWFIYRKRDENNLRTANAEFVVAANRFGPDDLKDLYFLDGNCRFEEPYELGGSA